MTAELIIFLVGALLVIVAIVDSALSLGLMDNKIKIPLGIVGILLMIFGGYSFGSATLLSQIEQVEVGNQRSVDYPVQKVQMTSPLPGDTVECRMLTMGVYPEGHEKDIWVLLKPSDEKYYPQSDHTNTSYKRNGEWQVITRFGGDEGEAFDIVVYEADAAASQFFTSTIEEWKAATTYPGLEPEDIPGGAREVERITVTLGENCRGVF